MKAPPFSNCNRYEHVEKFYIKLNIPQSITNEAGGNFYEQKHSK